LDRVLQRQSRLIRTMKGKFQLEKERLSRVQKSYAFRYPHRLYEQKLEQVDKLTEQLVRGTSRLTLIKKGQHEILHKRLQRNHPSESLREAQKRLDLTNKEMKRAMHQVLSKKRSDFERILSTLGALSPLKIMERGYSLAYSEDNRLVKSINQITINEQVQIQLQDGSLFCKVENIKESGKRDK
jgi:exodeoxyribonuclease VII large subunit